jgi:anti-sigma B factor antagonist
MEPPLTAEPITVAGAPGVALAGELDASGTELVEVCVRSALLDGEGALVLDLVGLTFMDSTGVNSLLRARSLLGRERRELVVVCPRDSPVRRVLELVGVADLLAPFETRAEAAAALVPAERD